MKFSFNSISIERISVDYYNVAFYSNEKAVYKFTCNETEACKIAMKYKKKLK